MNCIGKETQKLAYTACRHKCRVNDEPFLEMLYIRQKIVVKHFSLTDQMFSSDFVFGGNGRSLAECQIGQHTLGIFLG